MGARGARDPARRHRRLGGGAPDEPRRGRLRRHRRRPDRRERRHREQDRHLRARGAAAHHGIPLLRRRSDLDDRPGDGDRRRRSRSRSETGRRSTSRFAARNPAFDVTPAELVGAIVTEEGVHRAPYSESLPRVRSAHEGDHARSGVRDAALPADDWISQGAAAGRRPADARPGARTLDGRRGRRDLRRHERDVRAALRAMGERPAGGRR